MSGNSHIWHKKESLRYTSVFGKFACRITSKILGIGSAERAWGDVKHLKTNKRGHLSAERIKKQATIFGASCMQQAAIKKLLPQKKDGDETWKPIRFWTEDDYNKVYNEDEHDNEKPAANVREFNAWIEDWEQEAIRKNDPVAENKLLKKYGGLMWKDPDNNDMLFLSDSDSMQWFRPTKSGGGWSVIAYDQFYSINAEKKERDEHTEPWYITDDLIDCIEKYYMENSNEVKIVKKPNSEEV
jgi:hypothetical protein